VTKASAKKSVALKPARGSRAQEPRRSHAEEPPASTPLDSSLARRGTERFDVRQRILSASLGLIETEGLSALSMREVARRAGVSHQAPYNHFVDREAILGALAQDGFAILASSIEREREKASPSDFLSRLRAAFRAYVEFACSYPAHFRLMFRPELVDLDNCPGALAEGDRAFTYLIDGVREALLAGLPAEPSHDAVTALIWSTAHGLSCLLLDGPLAKKLPNAQREELIDGVTEAFTALIAARIASAASPAKARLGKHK